MLIVSQDEKNLINFDSVYAMKCQRSDDVKVLKVLWIGNFGVNILGIIKTQDILTQEVKIYIGTGKGICEQEDIALILAGGQKYTEAQFKNLFKEFWGE